ncbi:hypothetical protein DRP43_00740 [candidate division TA06 bacterium]|uniref:Uncharacterized protein n=1 Tax=candidate division TA06 bacterium TaxID=2250710 RepID=A0A660SNV7_UNCT6|nr:MAG: hypothetical protein DRP43_00740 [candidate division TA06 bacterium]
MYYRKPHSTTIVNEQGQEIHDVNELQKAVATVGNDISKFPIYGENQGGNLSKFDYRNWKGSNQNLDVKPRVSRYQKEAKTYYEGLDRTAPTPEDEAKIREETRKAMQAQIDAIEKVYKDMLTQEKTRGQERLGMTRAMAAAGGLLGSPMGEAQRQKTVALNKAQEQALQNEKQAKIEAILAKADERAERKIELEKAKAEKNEKEYLDYLRNAQEQSRKDMLGLAQSGVPLSKLKSQVDTGDYGKTYYEQLLEETGYSPLQFDALYNQALDEATKIPFHYKLEKGTSGKWQVLAYGVDPTTNKLVTEVYDTELQIPEDGKEWKFMIAPNGTPLLYTDQGDVKIPSGFREGQFAKPERPSATEEKREIYMEDWNKATKFINDNIGKPEATYETLFNYLTQYTPSLSEEDKDSLIREAGITPEEEEPFITTDYLKNLLGPEEIKRIMEKTYSTDELKKMAKEAGYSTKGLFGKLGGWHVSGKELEQYIKDKGYDLLMQKVNAYREAGYTDPEILDALREELSSKPKEE